jgi:CRISPR type III-A-associated protein Csm2
MPETISPEVLNTGITSSHIPVLQDWGNFLASGNPGKKKAMSTSQIRKFFGEIKRIQADFDNCKNEVILLDPKIAYAVGRAKKDAGRNEHVAIDDFYKLINPMLRKIEGDKNKFKRFVQVCESIVAYHKAAGGQ